MSTYTIRQALLNIARLDVNKTETSRNQADWIKKFWPATTYPTGYLNREPYCAAALCYWLQQWFLQPETAEAFGKSSPELEAYRCKSPAVFDWPTWAKRVDAKVLGKTVILHAADIVVYSYSHIELVSNDDNTKTGPFVAIGANTNASGSRDGEGCFEKPRTRASVKCFIRLID